ncbi:hypothetical protein GOODEAATRI_019732 [Goodea atripinnis]|uniref:SEC7 domain-containing protein n=1 Tax=Goodea atripinnis TaxID=208336 RepID=A0ABV0MJ87_9TELE
MADPRSCQVDVHKHLGVCYLIEHGFLEWRAESVAEFLYKEEGLNKTAIGNFLGERYRASYQEYQRSDMSEQNVKETR